jgi:hypothetical protein
LRDCIAALVEELLAEVRDLRADAERLEECELYQRVLERLLEAETAAEEEDQEWLSETLAAALQLLTPTRPRLDFTYDGETLQIAGHPAGRRSKLVELETSLLKTRGGTKSKETLLAELQQLLEGFLAAERECREHGGAFFQLNAEAYAQSLVCLTALHSAVEENQFDLAQEQLQEVELRLRELDEQIASKDEEA